jgi:hypothetical protein
VPSRDDAIREALRRRKPRIPARRRREKARIWNSYRDPVGFKFYGTYRDGTETKHFEFSVVVPRSMSRRAMYFWVKRTIRDMKWEDELPEGHYYHTYRGFWELHTRTDWVETDGIVKYNVDHTAT